MTDASEQHSRKFARAVQQLADPDSRARDAAWNVLYDALTPRLMDHFAHASAQGIDPHDIVSEAWGKFFLRVQRGLSLRADAIWPYLRQVCRRAFLDAVRRHDQRTVPISEDVAEATHEGHAAAERVSTSAALASLEMDEIAQLRRALLVRLRPAELALYTLICQGKSPASIAAALGITRSALDVRAYRLRRRIETMVEAASLYRSYVEKSSL